jgi:deoxyadenosine/deoxycytidine kinase
MLTDDEYGLCGRLYTLIRASLPFPELIVHLCADESTVTDRLSKRDRINIVSAGDITLFNVYLEEWLATLAPDQILELDVSNETLGYEQSLARIMERIRSSL